MLNLTRWNPFDELTDLHHELDRVFGGSWGGGPGKQGWSWVPATEVTSDEHGWRVRIGLPGIEPKDVHVEIDHNVLTVTGERAVKEEKTDRHLSEIGYGRFERAFTLPENVDAEKVGASFENGMLELTLPAVATARNRRRIKVVGIKKPEKAA